MALSSTSPAGQTGQPPTAHACGEAPQAGSSYCPMPHHSRWPAAAPWPAQPSPALGLLSALFLARLWALTRWSSSHCCRSSSVSKAMHSSPSARRPGGGELVTLGTSPAAL